MKKRKKQNADARQAALSAAIGTSNDKAGQPTFSVNITPPQERIKDFERKAGKLVSLMLGLTEEHMAAIPSGLAEMSPATSSAMAVKYAIGAYIKIMKLEKA